MKKLITKFAVLALGLTVMFASCSKEDDDRDKVIGTYNSIVLVDIPGVGTLPFPSIPIEVSKSGGDNLQISAEVDVPTYGKVTISNLQLQTVNKRTVDGVTGYICSIPQQKINVGTTEYEFKGGNLPGGSEVEMQNASAIVMSGTHEGQSARALMVALEQVGEPGVTIQIVYSEGLE